MKTLSVSWTVKGYKTLRKKMSRLDIRNGRVLVDHHEVRPPLLVELPNPAQQEADTGVLGSLVHVYSG
jgi:hypothetical protein